MKQETLKEASERILFNNTKDIEIRYRGGKENIINAMIEIAKWQQERSYSEEEVLKLLLNCPTNTEKETIEWFKQFKKK